MRAQFALKGQARRHRQNAAQWRSSNLHIPLYPTRYSDAGRHSTWSSAVASCPVGGGARRRKVPSPTLKGKIQLTHSRPNSQFWASACGSGSKGLPARALKGICLAVFECGMPNRPTRLGRALVTNWQRPARSISRSEWSQASSDHESPQMPNQLLSNCAMYNFQRSPAAGADRPKGLSPHSPATIGRRMVYSYTACVTTLCTGGQRLARRT